MGDGLWHMVTAELTVSSAELTGKWRELEMSFYYTFTDCFQGVSPVCPNLQIKEYVKPRLVLILISVTIGR